MKRKITGQRWRFVEIAAWCGLITMGFIACHNAKYQIIEDKNKGPQNIAGPDQEVTDTFHANSYQPLEIFFAVDTSSSLIQERQMLQDNMKSFIASFKTAGFESVRINIIGDSKTNDPKDCPRTNNFTFPADVGNVRMINKCIGSYNMISRMTEYFHGTPAPDLMADAGVELIMITDDNGQGAGNLAKDFDPRLGDRTIRVSAIVGIPDVTKPTSGCRVAMYGLEAIALSQATGGKSYNICNPDWSALIKDVAQDIQKVNRGYTLKSNIDTGKPIEVLVNGAAIPQSAFSFDVARHFLTFTSSYQVPAGASIEVKYSVTP